MHFSIAITPGVVNAVNALFSRLDPAFLIEGIDFEDAAPHEAKSRSTAAPPLELVFLDAETLHGPVASCVSPIAANEVALLLESGKRVGTRPIEPGEWVHIHNVESVRGRGDIE